MADCCESDVGKTESVLAALSAATRTFWLVADALLRLAIVPTSSCDSKNLGLPPISTHRSQSLLQTESVGAAVSQTEGICCIASSVKMEIKMGSMPHGVMGPLNYCFNFHTLLS